jgi:hypothetical protein
MSYPYPQDRNRDRREKGEQPYADARREMTESEARLQTDAEAFGEAHQERTAEERAEDLQAEAADLLKRIHDDERSGSNPRS